MTNRVFITGATGNIGGKLVTRILQDDPASELVLLIRGSSDSEAQHRLEDVLRTLSPEIDLLRVRSQIRVICGDITQEHFGLTETVLDGLASKVTHIIHSAATTQFQLPLECAHLVNVVGTRNVMKFTRRAHEAGSLRQAAYISTAYVCGDKGGTIFEARPETHGHFSNTYELTKWAAEESVRKLMTELPLVIFRPSIVVGDSQTGRTLTFNVLYTPLKYIHRGLLRVLPCSPDTPLDVVPVDFVSDAIHDVFLKSDSCVGKTYHIVAGAEKSPTVSEIVNSFRNYVSAETGQEQLARIKFVPSDLSRLASLLPQREVKMMLPLLEIYEPYLRIKRSFDNTNAVNALQGTDISAPAFADYCHNIFKYCLDANWGRQIKHAA